MTPLEQARQAIAGFLASITPESDNNVGGLEKLQLEAALDACSQGSPTLGGVSREMVMLAAGWCTGAACSDRIELDDRERNILKAAGTALFAAGEALYPPGPKLDQNTTHQE